MKKGLLLLCVSLIMFGCFRDDDIPFEFSDDFKKVIEPYQDTRIIYFKNEVADLDTLKVSSRNTIDNNEYFDPNIYRSISIDCKHLPINHWTAGFVISSETDRIKPINQTLINIRIDENSQSLYVNYRDFSFYIKELPSKIKSDLLSNLGITEYWEFEDEFSRGEFSINKVFWTEKYGLTAYTNEKGNFYTITDTP